MCLSVCACVVCVCVCMHMSGCGCKHVSGCNSFVSPQTTEYHVRIAEHSNTCGNMHLHMYTMVIHTNVLICTV